VARRAVTDLPADCGVTAVVCANDRLAAGAIRGASERGWRVPDDLSVTGWDDDPVANFMIPSITSVAIDYEELGRRATERLLEVLGVTPAPSRPTPIMRIIWRESTARAPDREARRLALGAQ
jgi:DNA-binding LacI/PurR family transcriptional regulator